MRKLLVGIVLLLMLIVGFFVWWNNGLAPANPADKSQHIFVVQKGEGIRQLANELKKQNLIKDAVIFFLYVKKEGLDNKIQAGDFRLSPSMKADQLADALTHGTLDIWITIPEGKRAGEIAEILRTSVPSYQEDWKTELEKHEGYLFPDTYLIPRSADITIIINLLTKTFEQKFSEVSNTTALTKEQVVIVASMVEREAKHDQDRPLVASVMINRLKIGMALQIDATVQYALGYQNDTKSWWKKDLTFEDLKINSPYNTYTNAGLPPAPISNPGFKVLSAVANPAKTDFMYYISDSSGNNHYGKTLNEHNANIAKYGL